MTITAFWLASYWFIQGRIIQAHICELFPWWPDSTEQPLIKGPMSASPTLYYSPGNISI